MTAFLLTGGILSDRIERRRVLIAADLARAAVLAVTGGSRSPACWRSGTSWRPPC
jgi:nitrate/nitrite transporter NarK